MGAYFDCRVYDGKLTRDEVQAKFSSDRSQSQYENDHSYSGAIGMLAGPVEFHDATFESVDAARQFLEDNHTKKWGPPWAVYGGTGDAARWVVGGLCSS